MKRKLNKKLKEDYAYLTSEEGDEDFLKMLKDVEAEIGRSFARTEFDTSDYPGMPEDDEPEQLNDCYSY